MKPDGAKSKFLNVDLDLHGMAGLDRLLAALESDIFVLNDGLIGEMGFAVLELTRQPSTIDEAIAWYAEAIGRLSPELRNVWNKLERRTMKVGIQAGASKYSTVFEASLETLAHLNELRTDLAFTVYRPDKENDVVLGPDST